MSSRKTITIAVAVVAAVAATTVFTLARDGDDASCLPPDVTAIEDGIDAATAWLSRAALPDGRYWYEYDRNLDDLRIGGIDARHAGTTMAAFQIAAAHDPDAVEIGDRGLAYILDNTVSDGEVAAFGDFPVDLHLGTTALAVAAMTHRRIATGEDHYDAVLAEMGAFMRLVKREDGGMWFGAQRPDFEVLVGQTSTFYTGEAFYAFGLLANAFPDAGWDDDASDVGNYLATARDEEEDIEHPPHPDQWAAYGFSEMRDWGPLPEAHVDYLRALIDVYHGRVGRELRREADRVGDGTGPPNESVQQSRGAAFGTTVEAVGSLWRLAGSQPALEDLRSQLERDLLCGAAILLARQQTPSQAAEFPRPEIVEGAWFNEGVTRQDDQQHAVSGLLLALEASGS